MKLKIHICTTGSSERHNHCQVNTCCIPLQLGMYQHFNQMESENCKSARRANDQLSTENETAVMARFGITLRFIVREKFNVRIFVLSE